MRLFMCVWIPAQPLAIASSHAIALGTPVTDPFHRMVSVHNLLRSLGGPVGAEAPGSRDLV